MARRKRRRLKKSVRRGCLLFFSLPFFVYLIFFLYDRHQANSLAEDAIVPKAERIDSLSQLSQRIDRLMHTPQRIDTSTIALEVTDLTTGAIVYSRHTQRLVAPASCMKLLTAVAAMQFLGPSHTLNTQVVTQGERRAGVLHGTLLFQLDDDPVLESLEPLVEAVRQKGIRRIEGDIQLQLMRDDTLRAHATAATWDIPYNRLPPLLKGRPRIEQDLRYLLASHGISFSGSIVRQTETLGKQPADTLYRHETPLADVLAPMLIHSSNIKADALFAHIATVCNRLPLVQFSPEQYLLAMAGLVAPDDTQRPHFVVNDGSGLSPDNRLTAHFLVQLLQYAWQQEDMRRILLDRALATPGHPERHGSLLGRMTAPMFRNKLFLKTGTLTTRALSSLAGYVQTADGRWLAFAIVNEDSPVAESRIFQDKICRELVN